ncbi:MAG: maleylpyruvate isomerase family mycothiol-dependent enzyme [Actinobacteria bacterium]|nr:maleylpyruvate isomerase family mycothiol-dependent enzyme [Actinomycetota bacterium]
MDVSDYIKFVKAEGESFASAAEQGELNVEIAACPGWDMREMVRHLGLIHLWAAANVANPQQDVIQDTNDVTEFARYWPTLAAWPEDADLTLWYRNTHANLVTVLENAPLDVECATFLLAASPLAMWTRRQASEIAMHRFDAEMSHGITSQFEPQFANDMLDELLSSFVPRVRVPEMENSKTIHIHAEDTDEHWYLTVGPERARTSRQGDKADLTLTATAADLYLLLWNRTPNSSVKMTGDTELMGTWHGNFRVRWS